MPKISGETHMSHIWKPLTLVASGAVVLGMMGLGGAVASAHSVQARKHPKLIIISDYQNIDNLNPFLAGTVFDTEVTALTAPLGNLSSWTPGPNGAVISFYQITTPQGSNNGLTWKFSVKPGQKWSNGQAITNTDYKLSWLMDMNSNVATCVSTCDDISGIQLRGKLGLTVTLKQAEGTTLEWLGVGFVDSKWDMAAGVSKGIRQKAINSCLHTGAGAKFKGCNIIANAYEAKNFNYANKSYVTAGPYQVKSWNLTSGIVDLTANPNYTAKSPGGKPSIKEIKYVPYGAASGNSAELIAAAAAHQADATEDYSLLDVGSSSTPGSLKSYGKDFTTYVASNANPELYWYNAYNANVTVDTNNGQLASQANPFYGSNGVLVRLALSLGFNRSGLIQNTFDVDKATADGLTSYCAPILCTPSGGGLYNGYHLITGVWDPVQGAYEPGKCAVSTGDGGDGPNNTSIRDAITLLNEAGYNSGNPLTVYLDSTTKAYRTNERGYLQSCWQAIASWVHVTTYAIPSTKLYAAWSEAGTYAHGNFEVGIIGYSGGPDPLGWNAELLSSYCPQITQDDGSNNLSCVDNSALDAALLAGGTATSSAARQADYNTVQTIMAKTPYWVMTAPLPSIWTSDGKMKGFQMNAWVSPETWNGFKWS
jgi:ABC-type transport system substrate-binding protein